MDCAATRQNSIREHPLNSVAIVLGDFRGCVPRQNLLMAEGGWLVHGANNPSLAMKLQSIGHLVLGAERFEV